ncbi:hypothetical protein AB0C52_28260 [Streptomyces sp. NPDC048717]|uniref:hypothetical protein n=1 Tax=Streptomyces sp. NPDC048717 TaxID=3154928 RepID=UPI003417207E
MLDRYERLAAAHTLTRRHRDAKSNESILREALAVVTAGREMEARRAGLVRVAVLGMVRKRGLPGSERHAALRKAQAAQAARPAPHVLAHLVADRLGGLPQESGVFDLAPRRHGPSRPQSATPPPPPGALTPALKPSGTNRSRPPEPPLGTKDQGLSGGSGSDWPGRLVRPLLIS